MNILSNDELNKNLIDNVNDLGDFIKNTKHGVIIFVENIKDLYKKSDNIIDEASLLFSGIDKKYIKISTIPFDELKDKIEIEFNSDNPIVVEIKHNEITNIASLYDFEKLLSLYELSSMLINNNKELENIFKSEKSSIILLTDDLDELSILIPEPKKNIIQLYKHFFKVDVSDLDINVLYSDADDLNNFLYSNDTDELPLPLLFKVDHTGALSFPIRIKKEEKDLDDEKYNNIDYSELMEKYDDILKDLE